MAQQTSTPWDAYPDVISAYGRPIEEQLTVKPRRMPLDGFEDVYCDFVDYIIRCTHRIWEEKGVGLIRTHYSDDCRVWMLSGVSVGAEEVIDNTVASLAAWPDRRPIGEDVIWSEDAPGEFLSSHRIVSTATSLGDDAAIGAARGATTHIMVVADCLTARNFIIDEYIVRDNAQLARQLGLDPREVARRAAAADREGDQSRHAFRAEMIGEVRGTPHALPPQGHPARPVADALLAAFERQDFDEAMTITSPTIESYWPSGRRGVGRGYWIGCILNIMAPLSDRKFRIDHWAARPLPDGDIAVAIRWFLTGRHTRGGVWGAPTGRELLILAISHYRLRGGRVIEDISCFDEVPVLRQVEGGLGA